MRGPRERRWRDCSNTGIDRARRHDRTRRFLFSWQYFSASPGARGPHLDAVVVVILEIEGNGVGDGQKKPRPKPGLSTLQ
jgi:hypothetical protein